MSRYFTVTEVERLTGFKPVTLGARRARNMPPAWVRDPTRKDHVLYPVEEIYRWAQSEIGGRFMATTSQLKHQAALMLGNESPPLPDERLEAAAKDVALLLLEADDIELAVKLKVASDNIASATMKHANLKRKEALQVGVIFAMRAGTLVTELRRRLTSSETGIG